MRIALLAAVVSSLSTAAIAQTTAVDPQAATGSAITAGPGLAIGTVTNPGQLDFGGAASSGIGTAGAPVSGSAITANPGQLDLGRSPSGTGGMPSGGAGIGAGSAGVPMTDDVYTQPIYGGAR